MDKKSGFDKRGETKQVIKTNDHNMFNEVANMGRNKGGMMDLGEAKPILDGSKHTSKCKWFNLSLFAKFMLVLIVLSSITKKGEIVRNIAPLGHCL